MIGRKANVMNMLVGRNALARRAFSTQLATTAAAAQKASVKSLWQWSNEQLAAQNAKEAGEAGYLAQLKKFQSERGVFQPLSEEASSKHLADIRKQINRVVEQELAEVDFKAQLASEDLAAAAYDEVVTKESFFFKVDEGKKGKNLAVRDFTAPGNKFRKPQVILPHEHCSYLHPIDIDGTDKDQLMEVYGHYAYMIDMHIAQVRPENLTEKSYIPTKYNQIALQETTEEHLDNKHFEFYHRWREPTRTWFSQTQEINHKKTLAERPTTANYDHDKGSKYEVEWREDQKFPHVATRLGYPILREEPIERIVGLERAPAHPGYQFQPFVQTPSMDPDPTLSFEQGETIYENRRVVEWVRFWKAVTVSTFGLAPGFYLFEIYAADGTPSIDWMAENWNWWTIPKQFQDGSGWQLESYRYCDDHDYMNVQYSGKRAIARPAHTAYVMQVLIMLQYLNFDYVSRMVYNRDKDLVFVYKPSGIWNETEHIHEVHHLEQMVPYAVTAVANHPMQRDDGIMTVYDMATRENLKFYGEDKYWNMDLKDEFMASTNGLWLGNFSNKRRGSIFHLDHAADEEEQLMVSIA